MALPEVWEAVSKENVTQAEIEVGPRWKCNSKSVACKKAKKDKGLQAVICKTGSPINFLFPMSCQVYCFTVFIKD